MAEKTIAARFKRDDAARQAGLEKVRLAAALTKSWVLPPINQQASDPLPEAYQAVGARGINNLEGRMLTALFPPGNPWYQLAVAAQVRLDPAINPDDIQAAEQRLFLWNLMIQSVLESASPGPSRSTPHSGFRSRKRMVLSQLLITGDALEQLTDDYRIKLFRRDQYVTFRDSSMDVIYHIIREHIDPLGLGDDEDDMNAILAAAGLKRSALEAKPASERMKDLFTMVEWQPISREWLIRQELNGHVIKQSVEQISPFFATPFELVPGEHYGRGFAELNLGDLRSVNTLEERILDFAALASKHHPVIDQNSTLKPADLTKPSGAVLSGRVEGGMVQDVGFLRMERPGDFNVVHVTVERKTRDLGRAMLLESETLPNKDRVTATQVQRIAMELEGALGGLYAPIAEQQQWPLIRRTIWQMKKDKLLPAFDEKAVDIEVLTGIAALSKASDQAKLMSLTQVVASLGPEALAKINLDVLVDVLVRYAGVYEPGLIKSKQQVMEEAQQAMKAQLLQQAGQKAVDVVGNAAEQQMTQQPNQGG